MSGQTPGPWTHLQRPNGLVHIVTADLDTTVAIIPRAGDFTHAHLLAAAPDLLAALEGLVKVIDGFGPMDFPTLHDYWEAGRAAIKSARGVEDS